ncbi:putative gamma-glutamyl phosphate reductase protein [Botrytis fragariae]|uniref:Putative gamma-glutamyl phosphate reductase protein n=1 Tax=Botrytis fragariae TaxID=1964551 RepID=A0A8H6AIV7_9HELO|nr:putative gamma-glutamyl phosphate reductase protein [Botrytis fragariae]KAF5868466.1 putative gamma-glutamyl phosphate reductase protein [Botrytis fragariae]
MARAIINTQSQQFQEENLLKTTSGYQELTVKQSLRNSSNYSFAGHNNVDFTWVAHHWVSGFFAIAQGRKRDEISPKKERETSVFVDSKTVYPVACNIAETISAEQSALRLFSHKLRKDQVAIRCAIHHIRFH